MRLVLAADAARTTDASSQAFAQSVRITFYFVFYGGIAQSVRALASHARGRRFESYCLYQARQLRLLVAMEKEAQRGASFPIAALLLVAAGLRQQEVEMM